MIREDITIIITTWNSLDYLKLCLDRLFKYTNIPFKLIISDNGSCDGTKEFINSLINRDHRKILYLRSEKNKGTIKALELAEVFITTRYVVLLDSDSVVSPNWLSVFYKITVNNPNIKMIGPMKQGTQYIYPYNKTRNSREVWNETKNKNVNKKPEKLLNIYCRDKSYEKFASDFLYVNNGLGKLLSCPPEILSGCCLFLDYKFLKACGGLTNSVFVKYGGHDADRCWRVSKAGGLILKTDEVYIHHFEGSSLRINGLEYQPFIYKNNRKLLDIWSREFWKFIKESKKSLFELANKYWLIRELLLSANNNQVPEEYFFQFKEVKKKFISTV